MEKNINTVSYTRPRSRRCKSELAVCIDCKITLNNQNWVPSMQKNRRYCCKDCWRTRQTRYAKSNPKTNEIKNKYRKALVSSWSDERKIIEGKRKYNSWLIKRYGITLKDYEALLEKQGNKCAICETTNPRGRGKFNVDHCHASGVVRSLLCVMCNMMIGMANDCPDVLRKAASYVADHKLENRRAEGGKAY